MTTRHWWSNCLIETDSEVLAIDNLENQIAPITANLTKIRGLIGSLEMCHHKAEKWVSNILEAIGSGETGKGLGPRKPGQIHPTEIVSKNACAALSAWNIALSPIRPRMEVVSNTLRVFCGKSEPDKEIDSDVLSMLGEPTEEKKWLAASLDKTIRLQLEL